MGRPARSETKLKDFLLTKFERYLPLGYLENYSEDACCRDLKVLQFLNEKNPLDLYFYTNGENIHLKIFQYHDLVALSKILPEFDRLGIYVNDRITYHFELPEKSAYVSDFDIKFLHGDFNWEGLEEKFKEALIRIWQKDIENDKLNSLILSAKLSWQEVVVLRAYGKYLFQLGLQITPEFLEHTLISQVDLASDLISLFILKFKPVAENELHAQKENEKHLKEQILQKLDSITNLDQDKVMRSMYTLIYATSRTNYFQRYDQDDFPTLALKFQADKMQQLMPMGPRTDTYVYSVRFEAIHRRSSKVARGGIRWSDRFDFSTEILGLMRTQTVKNSVIIPTGAKGGFLLKTSEFATPALFYQEGVECYKLFISSLLSITDNRLGSTIQHPNNTICYDEDDPYLVVAADKGTANFSDIANEISRNFNFWLDDAFASGGKTGYNHKVMGITAKGAWEAVKRHFLELNINIYQDTFTAVGIGDMSGDVFGNGMLLSSNVKLLGAFDHRHIFLDPNPDSKISYEERLRLFQLPTSSWQDYNPELISTGGGVFSRQLKSINLSPEIKKALAIEEDKLSPNELIQAILKAPVDLFWNGGIGTFVKASFEGHEQAADNTNRGIRIDANQLRCKVVGEGGNLGFTQNARIQYAQKGGRINTDFIDNVGGVDCSDREVNIKIALNSLVQANKMSFEERNKLLRDMQDQVAQLVLNDAHDQALAISLIEAHSKNHIEQYGAFLNYLEKEIHLNREKNNLPDDEELLRRKSAKLGLLRPQIAIILAQTKLMIKENILKTDIPDNQFLLNTLQNYFPDLINEVMPEKDIHAHLLSREIIATALSNDIVNRMGVTYLFSLREETGSLFSHIILSYVLISRIFSFKQLQFLIEGLDYIVPINEQYEIFSRLHDLAHNAAHWFLYNEDLSSLDELATCYYSGMEKLYSIIPKLMGGTSTDYMKDIISRFCASGMSEEMAIRLATIRVLYAGLNIIFMASHYHYDLEEAATAYFYVGQYFNIVWFRDNLFVGRTGDYWDNIARGNLRDKFDREQRILTRVILHAWRNSGLSIKESVEIWAKKNEDFVTRWNFILANIQSVPTPELSMFFVSVEELAKMTRRLIRANKDILN